MSFEAPHIDYAGLSPVIALTAVSAVEIHRPLPRPTTPASSTMTMPAVSAITGEMPP